MGIKSPTWDDVLLRSEATVQTVATRLSPKKQNELQRDKDLAEAEHKERLMEIDVTKKAKEAVIVVLEDEKKREQERWTAAKDAILEMNKTIILVQQAITDNPSVDLDRILPSVMRLRDQAEKFGAKIELDLTSILESAANATIDQILKKSGLDPNPPKGKKNGDVWNG